MDAGVSVALIGLVASVAVTLLGIFKESRSSASERADRLTDNLQEDNQHLRVEVRDLRARLAQVEAERDDARAALTARVLSTESA